MCIIDNIKIVLKFLKFETNLVFRVRKNTSMSSNGSEAYLKA